ncbi:hypothetical protein [Gluconacetobacter diazotrophicus]|uniref:hypothetical protein n=1 Tax=Gluconacetobacter diazotrophicus TaxID=33996 RepID=UPI0012FE9E21|nr:hypothetical protein [Gluconacetobacter diazotrophicus]
MKSLFLLSMMSMLILSANAYAEKIPDRPYTPGCYVHVDCGKVNQYSTLSQKVITITGGTYLGHDSTDRFFTLITYTLDGNTYRQEFEGIPNQWILGKAILIFNNDTPVLILNNKKGEWGAE